MLTLFTDSDTSTLWAISEFETFLPLRKSVMPACLPARFLPFVPVKIDSAASDDGPGLVYVIHLYDAVEVSNPSRPSACAQAPTG